MKTYHVAFLKDGNKLIVQMKSNIDSLSPQIWKYFGQRENTKKNANKNKLKILEQANKDYNTNFKSIKID